MADVDVFNIAQIEALPVTVDQLGQATKRDVDLSRVWQYVQLGWPDVVPEHLSHIAFTEISLLFKGVYSCGVLGLLFLTSCRTR